MWKPRTVTGMESAIKAVVKCHILSTQLLGLSNQYYSLNVVSVAWSTLLAQRNWPDPPAPRIKNAVAVGLMTVALGYDGFHFLVIVCRLSHLFDILCGHCFSSADGHTMWNL